MEPTLALALVLVTTSSLSVLAAMMIASALHARRGREKGGAEDGAAVFLVTDRMLVDMNARGSALLGSLPGAGRRDDPVTGWERLAGYLAPLFPDLGARLDQGGSAEWSLVAVSGAGLSLRGKLTGGTLRLSLSEGNADRAAGDETVLVDRLSWRALLEEVETLRHITGSAPTPIWREDGEGRVVWANGAYLRLLGETGVEGPLVWPLPALFARDAGEQGTRRGLNAGPGAGGRRYWFDLVEIDGGGADQAGAGGLFFALPADDAQRAERARRDFVQTLTKTFATLPVGLAVFDRTRRLQLFNPALTDLTRLEPEFLAVRPGLEGFLNRLRDKRVLPEPHDERAWTRRLLDVETAASGAGFEETWTLPDGRSFRVSAAPHPDGALAFLIEDVTSDIRLKRSFRAEIDAGQSALDMVETGVAAFSAAGDLVLTNAAFDRLWEMEGADTLAGISFAEAVANWREAGDDPALWNRIAQLAYPGTAETEAAGEMRLTEGEVLWVQARVTPSGGVMVAFTMPEPARAAPLRRASA